MGTARRVETVIFDMDGVLSHYDFARRMAVLSEATGVPPTEIERRIFGSGFDAAADEGAYSADEYMAEFSRRLGTPVSTGLWLEARRVSMTFDAEMLALASEVGERTTIAMLTNNGPVLRAHLGAIAPAVAETFGERAFFSCQFGTGKDGTEVFGLLLAEVGGDPASALFIDDTPHYVTNARAAGLRGHDFRGREALEAELEALGLLAARS